MRNNQMPKLKLVECFVFTTFIIITVLLMTTGKHKSGLYPSKVSPIISADQQVVTTCHQLEPPESKALLVSKNDISPQRAVTNPIASQNLTLIMSNIVNLFENIKKLFSFDGILVIFKDFNPALTITRVNFIVGFIPSAKRLAINLLNQLSNKFKSIFSFRSKSSDTALPTHTPIGRSSLAAASKTSTSGGKGPLNDHLPGVTFENSLTSSQRKLIDEVYIEILNKKNDVDQLAASSHWEFTKHLIFRYFISGDWAKSYYGRRYGSAV